MTVWEIIGGAVMILMSIAIVIIVGLQESTKGGGISALTGGDSYYNKNQGRTRDALLAKAAKFLAVGFFVVTIIVYALDFYLQ